MWYAICALPALFMLIQLTAGQASAGDLLQDSGEYSARFMIIALAVTPIRLLLPGARWTAWLVRRRRALGISACAYALLHTTLYLVDMGSLDFILAEFGTWGIWTGWFALLILLPLAATSSDRMVRWLGRRKWQMLHRSVYVAAVAVLIHWIYVHNNAGAAWLHFLPLIALEVIRAKKIAIR